MPSITQLSTALSRENVILKKGIAFTDIHWGAHQNSEQHNQDNLDFIDWMIKIIKHDQSIDHVLFLGDWYEHRNAIAVLTSFMAAEGAKRLNDVGLPVFFMVGNHDLGQRHTRDVWSTTMYEWLDNFYVINEPTVASFIHGSALLCPFVFQNEYGSLNQYDNCQTWWGHFEINGFVLTGLSNVMEHGADQQVFHNVHRVWSGHFHKRQQLKNICYIGNTFPTNFADANDFKRGCMVYDYEQDEAVFHDWQDAPRYIKTSVSELISASKKFKSKDVIRCLIDEDITYEECVKIKTSICETFNVRDFQWEEHRASLDTDSEEGTILQEYEEEKGADSQATLDDLVVFMLERIDSETIDPQILITEYRKL